MIDLSAAAKLLDMGSRIGQGHRAQQQLEGSVALHNILEKERVAYLADEVGMGKTFVALGALALFRHFNPQFRVLVIAPRENIQDKWRKELSNFVAHNLRFADLRMASIDRRPARLPVTCQNLVHFLREVTLDPNRDFFVRLSSFSLALGQEGEGWKRLRDDIRTDLPWLADEIFDLRKEKDEFKQNIARAISCALPVFDLVIVDEGHNLKYGLHGTAARNRILAYCFGHPAGSLGKRLFPEYGPKAKRVLFLSATPLEASFEHIWNQLDIFGLGGPFEGLRRDDWKEERKKELAARFLIRRVTSVRAGGLDMTKNQYRREWRKGGVLSHDQPIRIEDPRQRLVVALVQKKVAELLGNEKFSPSFQIGMLASFESFLETTRLKRARDEKDLPFDDPDQTEDPLEREGRDVRDLNRLTRDYRHTFGVEMPHPKMDTVVRSLSKAWEEGKKTLVFVRRVASVWELKRKLDENYNHWLLGVLRRRLPVEVQARFEEVVKRYEKEKKESEEVLQQREWVARGTDVEGDLEHLQDRGGEDTFFAWFFRGEGPRGVVSGANIQKRFIQKGTVYSTFFAQNHVMDLLGSPEDGVRAGLVRATGLADSELGDELRRRSAKYLGRAKKPQIADRLEAVQAAGVELLKDRASGPLKDQAAIVWHERYQPRWQGRHESEPPDVGDLLETTTFFTELQRPEWIELRRCLWPEPQRRDPREQFRERELRAQLLATAARLGHSLIDLYILTIGRLRSLDLRTLESSSDGGEVSGTVRIREYLGLLEQERRSPIAERGWAAFDELQEISSHFDLILDVNAPEARNKALFESATYFGRLLREQQPVGGMSGQINKVLVHQFRMPGYPFVLISTDLLQEGEDLHTFCSSVQHYGISWTPSSMEQRIGRIDRVRSHTERRLSALEQEPAGDDLLQVYFPYLEDTVEVLQVDRVLERMNVFLQLMHEGLASTQKESRKLDVGHELTFGRRHPEAIRERLRTAYPVPVWATRGETLDLETSPETALQAISRFEALRVSPLGGFPVDWERPRHPGALLGTVRLSSGRIQPIALLLRSEGKRLLVRCVSPIGRVGPADREDRIVESAQGRPVRVGAIISDEEHSYDLTLEDDVLLGDSRYDLTRVGLLVGRVAEQADRLEQTHLPKADQPLKVFESDLEKEGNHAGT